MIDKLVRQGTKFLTKYVYKYRIILICLIILFLFGYTLWQFRSIANPQPDPNYLRSNTQANQTTKIQIKDSLRQQIEQLQETPTNVTPGNVGKPDPFSP